MPGGPVGAGVWTAGAKLPVTSQGAQDEVSTLWGLQSPNNLALAHLCSLTSLSPCSHPPLPCSSISVSGIGTHVFLFIHYTCNIGTAACSFNLHVRYSVLQLTKFLPAFSLHSHPHLLITTLVLFANDRFLVCVLILIQTSRDAHLQPAPTLHSVVWFTCAFPCVVWE